MPKFHDYMIIFAYYDKVQFPCKVVRKLIFKKNFLFLKEIPTPLIHSFSEKSFDVVLVFTSFSFYFKVNTNATIHLFLDFVFAKVPLLYAYSCIFLKSAIFMYIVCKFYECLFYFFNILFVVK